jgi:hypothetical protein
MYQFSRSIYRELSSEVVEDGSRDVSANRLDFLKCCEAAMDRLAGDRHYFARPARSLFRDVRVYFPMNSQMHVYRVIEHYVALAVEYVDRHMQEGVSLDGSPLSCHASTRKGTACQRIPLPGSKYCPSHKHLEERVAATAA